MIDPRSSKTYSCVRSLAAYITVLAFVACLVLDGNHALILSETLALYKSFTHLLTYLLMS